MSKKRAEAREAAKGAGALERKAPSATRTEPAKKDRKAVLALRRPGAPSVAATMGWLPNAVQPFTVVVKLPKRTEQRPRSDAESDYLGRVKQLPCVLCLVLSLKQESPTDAHHVRVGQGGAQRAMDWLTAAICHDRCHQGPHGIHGDRSLLRQAKCTEIDLLGWTLALMNGERIAA